MAISARVRSNFSMPHLLAAAKFSREAEEIELNNAGKPFGPFWDDILSLSIACVLECVASLESYINELFVDYKIHFPNIDSNYMEMYWELLEQKTLTEKFAVFFFLKNSAKLDRGVKTFQDIETLIKLRNGLTHFKPEWENEQVTHRKISDALKPRFSPSPFMTQNDPIFPKSWATSGCTIWAVEATTIFIQNFENTCSLPIKIDAFLDRLKPKK